MGKAFTKHSGSVGILNYREEYLSSLVEEYEKLCEHIVEYPRKEE
jgi:hypothetical protein